MVPELATASIWLSPAKSWLEDLTTRASARSNGTAALCNSYSMFHSSYTTSAFCSIQSEDRCGSFLSRLLAQQRIFARAESHCPTLPNDRRDLISAELAFAAMFCGPWAFSSRNSVPPLCFVFSWSSDSVILREQRLHEDYNVTIHK